MVLHCSLDKIFLHGALREALLDFRRGGGPPLGPPVASTHPPQDLPVFLLTHLSPYLAEISARLETMPDLRVLSVLNKGGAQ